MADCAHLLTTLIVTDINQPVRSRKYGLMQTNEVKISRRSCIVRQLPRSGRVAR